MPSTIPKVEAWARREMQSCTSDAERAFMASVTHKVASLFLPESGEGRVTAEQWAAIAANDNEPKKENG